jgi:hypothetical protein
MLRILLIALTLLVTVGCNSNSTKPKDAASVVFDSWYSNDGKYAYGYVKNVGTATANSVQVLTQAGGQQWTNDVSPSSLAPQGRGTFQAFDGYGGSYPPINQIDWK